MSSSCANNRLGVFLLLSILFLLTFQLRSRKQENFVGNSEVAKVEKFIKNYKSSLIEAFGKDLFSKIGELEDTLKDGGVLINNDRSMWDDFVEFMNIVNNLNSKETGNGKTRRYFHISQNNTHPFIA